MYFGTFDQALKQYSHCKLLISASAHRMSKYMIHKTFNDEQRKLPFTRSSLNYD